MSNNRFTPLVVISLVMILIIGCASQSTATPDLKQSLTGTWTSTVTKEDILRVMPEFEQQYLCDNTGTFVWKFNEDGSFTIDQTPLADCPASGNPHIEDKWSLEGNLLTLAPETPYQEIYEINMTDDQLIFKVKSSDCVPCIAVNTANPWTPVK